MGVRWGRFPTDRWRAHPYGEPMKPTTRTLLLKVATIAAGTLGTLCIASGLLLLWFTTSWSDAFGTEPEYTPGLVLVGLGGGSIVAMISLRKQLRRAADRNESTAPR